MLQVAELAQQRLQCCGLEPASKLSADGESSDDVHSRKLGRETQVDVLKQAQYGQLRWWRFLLAIPPAMLWIIQQPRDCVPARNYVVLVTTYTDRAKTIMLEPVVRVAG